MVFTHFLCSPIHSIAEHPGDANSSNPGRDHCHKSRTALTQNGAIVIKSFHEQVKFVCTINTKRLKLLSYVLSLLGHSKKHGDACPECPDMP